MLTLFIFTFKHLEFNVSPQRQLKCLHAYLNKVHQKVKYSYLSLRMLDPLNIYIHPKEKKTFYDTLLLTIIMNLSFYIMYCT